MSAPRAARAPARTPLSELPGVGPVRSARLAKLGLETVRDLLVLVPRRVEPAARVTTVAEARAAVGERVRLRAVVRGLSFYRRGRRRSVLRVRVEDASGKIDLLYFNQPWQKERFPVDLEVLCEGRVVDAGGPALPTPRLVREDDEVLPLVHYPLTEGIGQGFLRGLVQAACERHAGELAELVPPEELAALGLPPLTEAVLAVHRPEDEAGFEAGRRRLGLERLLSLQARLAAGSGAPGRRSGSATAVELDDAGLGALAAAFPAPFTAAQRRVARELRDDLARRAPMRRLLQGDVGSGKTWVGALGCLAVARAGGQAAFLAPTELLAEQHALGLAPLFEALGLRAELVTGSLPRARRRAALEALAAGAVDVAVGTHALLSGDVRFARLALAVVDEQHRFGVAQRERLFQKGRDVHVLLMTATPIPRTLALTVYGDLDVSVLDERPPGRGAVRTRRVPPEKVAGLRAFVAERAAAGERAFWIAPRIDGEGGAEEAFAAWRAELEGVELVHGRVRADERAERLARFRSGASPLLVATTVVEVGVDVPEATVMAVAGADRLGLAQLHQLRGRVGRGERDAWCFLMADGAASARLEALERTDDGFELAELDLALRGMGSLAGVRQAGFNDEGLTEVALDLRLVELARRAVREDPALAAFYAADASSAGRRR